MNQLFPPPALSIAGFIVVFFSIIIFIPDYKDKEIIKNGKIVNVVIEKTPAYCKKKSRRDILVVFFKHHGKTYSRNVSEEWCEKIKRRETLQMKSNDDENRFVFTWETGGKQNTEIGSGVLLISIGLLFVCKGYFDRNKKILLNKKCTTTTKSGKGLALE